MANIDKKFIISLHGKDFVKYEGLLDLAHKDGLKTIDVEILQFPSKENGMTAICKATAITDKGSFSDIGDANPQSVSKNIAPHLIRMASTRAKARALRDLNNIGMTALEELADDEVVGSKSQSRATNKEQAQTLHCSACGAQVSSNVANWSKKNHNKILCMSCQKKVK
jgi:hypothetical protein